MCRLRCRDDRPDELVTTMEVSEEEDEPKVLTTTTEALTEEAEETTRPTEHLQSRRQQSIYRNRKLTMTTVASVEEDGLRIQ